MRAIKLLLILLTAATFASVTGCSEQQQPAAQKEESQTTMEDIKKEARELVDTTKSYTMEQKEAYEQQLADKFATYETKLSALKEQMAAVKGEAEKELQGKIDTLQAKVADMKDRTGDLKNASGQAWEDLKAGLDKAGDDLDKAFFNAMQNYRKSSSSN